MQVWSRSDLCYQWEPVSNGSPTSWMIGMEFFYSDPWGKVKQMGDMKQMGGDMEEIRRNNWDSQMKSACIPSGRFLQVCCGNSSNNNKSIGWCRLQKEITANVFQDVQQKKCRVTLDASKNANLTYPTPWFILWLWMKNQMKQMARVLFTKSQKTPRILGKLCMCHVRFMGKSPNFRCGWNIPLSAATWRFALFSFLSHKSLGGDFQYGGYHNKPWERSLLNNQVVVFQIFFGMFFFFGNLNIEPNLVRWCRESLVEWTQSREGDLGLGGTCAFVSCLHVCCACFQCQRFACVNCTFCCTGQLWVACAQAVVLARLLGLMHVCLHAYVVAYVCTYPSAVEKSVPCCRFALCYMNLFMCFVLPSFLLSKSLHCTTWARKKPWLVGVSLVLCTWKGRS